MVSPINNVALLGAGTLGSHVLEALASNPLFSVWVVTRGSASTKYPPNVKFQETDYSYQSLVSIFKENAIDAVVSTVPHYALEAQDRAIEAAVAAGVKRFVPSDFGTNTSDERTLDIATFLRPKAATVAKLSSLEGKGPNGEFSWTSVITGPFFELGIKTEFLGLNLAEKSAVLYDGGNTAFSVTTLSQIGKAVSDILSKPLESVNRYVFTATAKITQRNLLNILEKETGVEWTVTERTTQELLTEGKEKVSKGDLTGYFNFLFYCIFQGDNTGNLWDGTPGLTDQESPESVVKRVLAELS
ncbi:hypothetical protein Asppvi_000004 [Aspergillus pseudoviridinutans]|uniref:NmrA-like domain-containing protein n=1 Tax=Aspergillus pseudoviridinutans TaxID=1517512 RepID=A0A9P3EQE5_9EURO|nr:uncharacterized protein Asppvi_000004 [Aspergillus pseudoviridinutans]GIJ81505.1 hypothetical protein Asppvi_000004 [Aspergillus pseudoviridinutans]